jgi:anti-sigma B factor antagonist
VSRLSRAVGTPFFIGPGRDASFPFYPGRVIRPIRRIVSRKRGSSDVELVFEGNEERLTIKVIGEVVADSSSELRESILQVVNRKPKEIVLDLSEMPFIDTSGLGVLIGLRSHMKKYNVGFTLRNPQERVLHVFRLTQISRLFGLE